MQEKMEVIGLNIINYLKFKTDTDDRVTKLEKMMVKCFTTDQFREESQLTEQRTLKQINERLGDFQENLNGYREELSQAVTAFGKKTDDVQGETLWRIKECEELLRNRVSEKFVMDALHSLDEKIKNQVNHVNDKGIERLEKTFKEVSARVTQTNQFFNDKLDDVRKIMAAYDSRFSNVASNSSVEKVQQGYKDMKYNFERELELIQDHMKEV